MIQVEEIDGGLRVVDAAKNEVEIEIEDWEPGGEPLEIGRQVDLDIAGLATKLALRGQFVSIESSKETHWKPLKFGESYSAELDDHLIQISQFPTVFLRTTSRITVQHGRFDMLVSVTLPEQTMVTLGFRDISTSTPNIISIPPTLEGVSAALTEFGSQHETESPDRSYPSLRGHPPIIEIDEEASPNFNSESGGISQPLLSLPPSLSHLFVASPLAYYIGAIVKVSGVGGPTLETDKNIYNFSADSRFPIEASKFLSHLFHLDCIVRNFGPYGIELEEMDILDKLALDPVRLYHEPMGERIDEYMKNFDNQTMQARQDWPIWTMVKPSMSNLSVLPSLLDRLSMIHPLDSNPVARGKFIKSSLGGFYRTSDSTVRNSGDSEFILPNFPNSGLNGWLGEGIPVEGFKGLKEGFQNRWRYETGAISDFRIAIVLNDRNMESERNGAIDLYRNQFSHSNCHVGAHVELTQRELEELFDSSYDFVHYIGHCDDGGLQCRDGYLPLDELAESKAKTFFLNACDSYGEGLKLVRRGSIAGAVIVGDIIDAQAEIVGVTFAKLLFQGFDIERALDLARSRIMINKQYLVVGDGGYHLTSGGIHAPSVIHVSDFGSDGYVVNVETICSLGLGGVYQPLSDSKRVLAGNVRREVFSTDEFITFCSETQAPTFYNDKFYWPDELLDELF